MGVEQQLAKQLMGELMSSLSLWLQKQEVATRKEGLIL